MKSVMWIQSDKADEQDHFFIDGVLISEDDITTRDGAVRVILKAQDARYYISGIERLRESTGSPNFTIGFSVGMGFLYKSVFNEKAKDGRGKAFVLWCERSEMDSFWTIAGECASHDGYTLREREREIVQDCIAKIKKRYFAFCFFIVAVISSFLAYASTK